MILPAFCAIMPGTSSRASRKGARRFTAIVASQSSTLASSSMVDQRDAGIVDQDVDGAESRRAHPSPPSPGRPRVRHVGGDRHAAAALRLDGGLHLGQALRHRGPRRRCRRRHRPAPWPSRGRCPWWPPSPARACPSSAKSFRPLTHCLSSRFRQSLLWRTVNRSMARKANRHAENGTGHQAEAGDHSGIQAHPRRRLARGAEGHPRLATSATTRSSSRSRRTCSSPIGNITAATSTPT